MRLGLVCFLFSFVFLYFSFSLKNKNPIQKRKQITDGSIFKTPIYFFFFKNKIYSLLLKSDTQIK